MSGTSLSNFLTAAILASGVDGGPSVDIGKPMAIHKTTTKMKMDNKHQCCRRKWTPKEKRRWHKSFVLHYLDKNASIFNHHILDRKS